MSLPAFQLPPKAYPDGELCPSCVVADGLCGRDDCRRAVLPLIAENRGWLKLIGEARVEQKRRQDDDELAVSVEQTEHKKRKEHTRSVSRAKARKNARAIARSQRRGLFGLHRKIANP